MPEENRPPLAIPNDLVTHGHEMPAPFFPGLSHPVEKRRKDELRLRTMNTRISLALRAVGIGVWEWNFKTNTLLWDEKMYEIYGLQPGTPVTSERWKSVVHPEDLKLASGIFSPAMQHAVEEKRRFRIVHPVRGLRVIEAAQELLLDATGAPVAWIGGDQDVTEWFSQQNDLQAHAAEMERLSLTDPLTGVGNRRKLEAFLSGEIVRARRYGSKLSLLFADLDYFKQVNDAFGHDVGDLFICSAAQTIVKTVRETDLVARLGGDEFCVVAPEIASEEITHLAARINACLAQEKVYPLDRPLTASFGAAQWRDDESADSLMRRADRMLYQAKANGRNQVCADFQMGRDSLHGDAVIQPHPLSAAAKPVHLAFNSLSAKNIAVNPFPGIGKEQLAAEYAEAQLPASPPPFN